MTRASHVTPCRKEAEQEMAEGQVDQAGDRFGTPDARQDMAHAQARARQTQVPTREASVTQGEEQETQAENIPAAQVVAGRQLVTGGQQPTVSQEPSSEVKNQPPRLIGRPKMPAFVLRMDEERRREQAEVSHGGH